MSDWLVAVNRSAGKRPVDLDRVVRALDAVGVGAEVIVPANAAEMHRIVATEAAGGRPQICVTGGDGTVNVAVNALMTVEKHRRPVLGVLPAGTGCDLLRTFGLPQDLEAAAKHLATDSTYEIDVVMLEADWGVRHFVNVAQAGVGAAAAGTAARLHRSLGAARYPAAFLYRLPSFPRASIRLQTDRRTIETQALAVILANAQFFAGGWNVAPRAMLGDGVIDIQIIDERKLRAPALVPKVVKGTHLSDPAVRRTIASRFVLETEPIWPIEVDGDIVGNTGVEGRVVPAAIRLKI